MSKIEIFQVRNENLLFVLICGEVNMMKAWKHNSMKILPENDNFQQFLSFLTLRSGF